MSSSSRKLTIILALGVACTTASGAFAQESSVAAAREQARSAPTSLDAALAYGRTLRRAGREADALVELRRALGLAGGNAETASKVEWEIARTHVARRDFQQALATCRTMEKGAPAASHACAAEAHLLWRRGTEASAELAAIAGAKSVPADVQVAAKVAEGRVDELASKDDDAETAYKEAIRLAPDAIDAHVRLGTMLQRLGRDGLPELRRAVALDARDPEASFELGRALPVGSAEALSVLEKAVAERPTYTDALRSLAEGYVAANRLADAKRVTEQIIKIAPNDVLSHVVSGRVALAEGKADDAIREGETASKLMPNAAAAKLLVADAWAKKGEIDLAIESYQAAFGLDHSDPTPLVNAAEACVAAGRPTSAKAFARRATQDFPAYGPAWVALGDALAADKETAAARSAYESAKKSKDVDPKSVDAKLLHLR